VLLIAYALYLVFMLKTHPGAFAAKGGHHGEEAEGAHWSVPRAVGTLVGASVLAAWMSEILVGAAEGTGTGARHDAGVHRHRVRGNCRRGGRDWGEISTSE
jgi:Ca2+/H+ antiporter